MDETKTENIIRELVRNRQTKQQGVSLLIETYQELLYWHIRKMLISHDDSKDVLQEVFVRVWQNIHSFRGDSKIYTWLFRIATNEISRFLEKKQRQLKNDANLVLVLKRELENPDLISGDEIQIKLQQAILQLPVKQRLVFNMRYFDEMEYKDISEILDTSVNSLKVSFHHAKAQIEEILKEELL